MNKVVNIDSIRTEREPSARERMEEHLAISIEDVKRLDNAYRKIYGDTGEIGVLFGGIMLLVFDLLYVGREESK